MKKIALIFIILILIGLAGTWAFLSLGRAGGEIWFSATVTQVEDDVIYATVTEDNAGFGSRRLPETIVIYKEFLPEQDFQQDFQEGDQISGIYIRKEYKGEFYRVVSIGVN